MTTKQVLEGWGEKVKFPWSFLKLRKAGFDPVYTYLAIAGELTSASDYFPGLEDKVDQIVYAASVLSKLLG